MRDFAGNTNYNCLIDSTKVFDAAFGKYDDLVSTQQSVSEGRQFTESVKKCIGNDPLCPCQDGDMCHYEGPNAWPVPDLDDTRQKPDQAMTFTCPRCGARTPDHRCCV